MNKKLVVEINGRSSDGKHCRVWVNKLDRKDGTFIVRYKIYETCLDLSIHIYYGKKEVVKSPYKFKGKYFPYVNILIFNIFTHLKKASFSQLDCLQNMKFRQCY